MLKKVTFILISMGLLQILILACCPDPQTVFSRILDLRVENYNELTPLQDSAAVAQENYRVRLFAESESFTAAAPAASMLSAAYATSCEDIFRGLASPVAEFEISANIPLFGVNPGEALPYDQFAVWPIYGSPADTAASISIEQWIETVNSGEFYSDGWFFVFKDSLSTQDYLQLNFWFKQNDGTEFQSKTSPVKLL